MKRISPILFVLVVMSSLVANLSICSELEGFGIVEERIAYCKKEVIQGMVFVFREDTLNGVCTRQWTIDGRSVDEQDYNDELLDAEREVLRMKREREDQRRIRMRNERYNAFLAVNKKRVRLALNEIMACLEKLEQPILKPYLAFSDNTYATKKDFDALQQELVPKALQYISLDNPHDDVDDYKELLAKLDAVPGCLTDLYYATIHNAIAVCNDTKMLKELLEMISQA